MSLLAAMWGPVCLFMSLSLLYFLCVCLPPRSWSLSISSLASLPYRCVCLSLSLALLSVCLCQSVFSSSSIPICRLLSVCVNFSSICVCLSLSFCVCLSSLFLCLWLLYLLYLFVSLPSLSMSLSLPPSWPASIIQGGTVAFRKPVDFGGIKIRHKSEIVRLQRVVDLNVCSVFFLKHVLPYRFCDNIYAGSFLIRETHTPHAINVPITTAKLNW